MIDLKEHTFRGNKEIKIFHSIEKPTFKKSVGFFLNRKTEPKKQ
jgi:hypothetical protein